MKRSTLAVLFLVGCGGSGGGPDPTANCGDLEVAPGYPKLGGECRARATFTVDGAETRDMAGATGVAPGIVSDVGVGDGTDALYLVMPDISEGVHGDVDCGMLQYAAELNYLSNLDGHFNLTLHGDATAIWGDFESEACDIVDEIVIDGEIMYFYECRTVVGKLAALREPTGPTCGFDCGQPTVEDSTCLVPFCGAGGQLCGRVTCEITSALCSSVAPVPDGTYAGFLPTAVQVTFAGGTVTAIRIDDIYEPLTAGGPPDLVSYAATTIPPSAVVHTGARYEVNVPMTRTPAAPGTGQLNLQLTVAASDSLTGHGFLISAIAGVDGLALDGPLTH